MTIIQALLLGAVQGLTEFLPVSSSGHLVIVEALMKIDLHAESLMGFDVIMHTGTLLALLFIYGGMWIKMFKAFFHTDIPEQPGMTGEYRALLLSLIVATIPAIIAGILFKDLITDIFRSETSVGFALIITAVILIISEKFPQKHRSFEMQRLSALWIGIAQAFALIPGLSRAGLTIGVGRITGLSRREALDFSFMMAVPVILGATILTVIDALAGTLELPSASITFAGFVASFAVSMVAILFLRSWVIKRSLAWFAVYLIPVGLLLVFA